MKKIILGVAIASSVLFGDACLRDLKQVNNSMDKVGAYLEHGSYGSALAYVRNAKFHSISGVISCKKSGDVDLSRRLKKMAVITTELEKKLYKRAIK